MATESVRKFARNERQLFLDDADIARIDGLKTRMHRPEKKGAVVRTDPYMAQRTQQDHTPYTRLPAADAYSAGLGC